MSKIFINYRRSDSAGYAGRLYDRLVKHFGADHLFMDIDQIEPGEDFVEVLQKKLQAVQVAVVLIGKSWLDSKDETGQRRLDNPDDWVRIEIATLLERKIRVIPVLVGGAVIPRSSQLPESLILLARRQAFEISDTRFHSDVDKLIQTLEKIIPSQPAQLPPKPNLDTFGSSEPDDAKHLKLTDALHSPAQKLSRSAIEQSESVFVQDFEPQMVRIPPGTFIMGSPESEAGRSSAEGPQRKVTLAYPFEIGRYEVTFAQYDAFAKDTKRKLPHDVGWGCGDRPVINVSWHDAQAYVKWLSDKTGKKYRLPTEAEWEYVARAGTTTAYWWGEAIGKNNAVCDGCGSQWDGKQTAPVGSFKPNAFGVYDTAGNVWEWTQDCWHDDYTDAPIDGSAWLEKNGGDCSRRVVRGGSWDDIPQDLRSALRFRYYAVGSSSSIGFRVARDF